MLVESRAWGVAALLAILTGLCANPLLSTAALHLFTHPGYQDAAPAVMIDIDTVHFGSNGLVPGWLVDYWRGRTKSIESFSALLQWNLGPQLRGERVEPGLFEMLGAKPWRGRTLGPEDERAVVVSYEWARGDASWVGREAHFGWQKYRVAGIMPPGFRLVQPDSQVWLLLPSNARFVEVIARLRPGATPEAGQAELRRLALGVKQFHAGKLELLTLKENRLRDLYFAASMLKWNFGFVLLVALGSMARFVQLRRRTITLRQQLGYTGFLLAKSFLILTSVGVIWIVVADPSVERFMSGNFAMPLFFWAFLLASWGATFWCLRDQQNRCRVCLEVLRMPVDSGRWSSLVLDRPRTEYICPFGHGTLYVPGTRLLDIDSVNWTSHEDIWHELFQEPATQ